MSQITDNDFTLRCCWMCRHCKLEIEKGYVCTANPDNTVRLGGNVEIHLDRSNCPSYERN